MFVIALLGFVLLIAAYIGIDFLQVVTYHILVLAGSVCLGIDCIYHGAVLPGLFNLLMAILATDHIIKYRRGK